MKVITVLGTRPEIIRLRCVMDVLDETVNHIIVHTGQNFDERLSQIFFDELKLRDPDIHLGIVATSFADQVGRLLPAVASVLQKERPDGLLVLGDTNSGLCSIVAKRLGVPVYHMEAGNRCFDDRVPEEVNRRLIDHSSSVLMPYTHRSKENLLAEGIERRRIFVTGNPIWEVLTRYEDRIGESAILDQLGLEPQGFFLATIHRAETVDSETRLRRAAEALDAVANTFGLPIICSLHPRTADRMRTSQVRSSNLKYVQPLGFFDFVHLEKAALCVLSDSGTVQEECSVFKVPAVTVREVTERPETIECGSNILSGIDSERVVQCVEAALRKRGQWTPPIEYLVPNVSEIVGRVILGF